MLANIRSIINVYSEIMKLPATVILRPLYDHS